MIAKALASIKEADVQALMDNSVPEGKTVDYKRDLPGSADEKKKEFLADISSFGNTVGGDIYYGIEEAEGIPKAIPGLGAIDVDAEIQRMESILVSGLEPRMRYEIRSVPFSDGRIVIMIRIERSWVGPHRVTFKSHDKFYGRNSSGKYSLDVGELRVAFGYSQEVAERIRNFRAERTMAMVNNATPVPMKHGSKLILHCIPFQAFAGVQIDISKFYNRTADLRPMASTSWSDRINLDGVVSFSGGRSNADTPAYLQLYRSGIIESVEATLLNREYQGKRVIPSIAVEELPLEHLGQCINILRTLGIRPPLAIALTLTNVKGMAMGVDDMFAYHEPYTLLEEHLILPEIIVHDFDEKVPKILKPIFDLMWNACGYESSRYFDKDGNPTHRRR
jgi:hypothetical protein